MSSCAIPGSGPVVRTVGSISRPVVERVRRLVARQSITETVVRDALAAGYPLEDAVNMDEYTIDLVFRVDDGATPYWLVYDTT